MAKAIWFWVKVVFWALLFGMAILDGIHKGRHGMDESEPLGVIPLDKEVDDESRRT